MGTYYTTRELFVLGVIPEEYEGQILETCPYCESDIIRTDNLTQAKCSNFYCIGHMKYKANAVLKHFGIKGFGPEFCAAEIRRNEFKHHLEILSHFYNGKIPLRFWELIYLMQIEGYSTIAKKDLLKYTDLDDYLRRCNNPEPTIIMWQEVIRALSPMFEFIGAKSGTIWECMISGSVQGFASKKDFVTYINREFGEIIQIVQTSGVKKSAHICITENKDSSSKKVRVAREVGMKILKPMELIYALKKVKEGGI